MFRLLHWIDDYFQINDIYLTLYVIHEMLITKLQIHGNPKIQVTKLECEALCYFISNVEKVFQWIYFNVVIITFEKGYF